MKKYILILAALLTVSAVMQAQDKNYDVKKGDLAVSVTFNPGSLGAYSRATFGNLSLSDNGFLLSHGEYDNIK